MLFRCFAANWFGCWAANRFGSRATSWLRSTAGLFTLEETKQTGVCLRSHRNACEDEHQRCQNRSDHRNFSTCKSGMSICMPTWQAGQSLGVLGCASSKGDGGIGETFCPSWLTNKAFGEQNCIFVHQRASNVAKFDQ